MLARASVLASVLGFACAGTIEDEQPFLAARGVEGVPVNCPDVPSRIFADNCTASICHDADEPSGNLDLTTPGIESRIVGKQVSDVVCKDRVLVDEEDPEASFMLEKLESPVPACGDPMPLTGDLSSHDVACVRQWLLEVARAGGGAGDAAPADSGPGDSGP